MGNKMSKVIVHQLFNQKDFSFQKVLIFYGESFMMATGLQPQSIYSKLAQFQALIFGIPSTDSQWVKKKKIIPTYAHLHGTSFAICLEILPAPQMVLHSSHIRKILCSFQSAPQSTLRLLAVFTYTLMLTCMLKYQHIFYFILCVFMCISYCWINLEALLSLNRLYVPLPQALNTTSS